MSQSTRCSLLPEYKNAFQEAVWNDNEMHALSETIIESWLNDDKAVPTPLQNYWNHKDLMMVEDKVILCG